MIDMLNLHDVKVVSFDAEGTLVTPDFSYAVWFEAIPQRYAEKNGINLEQARKAVEEEYRKVGDQKLEWYDIGYWFDKLRLGTPAPVLKRCKSRVCYYPEVKEVLMSLGERYRLIVSSGSAREFLAHLLQGIEPHFYEIYSSISDFRQLKTPEFYLKICQSMRVAPEQIVHVGDNWQFDLVAPSSIGIQAFHLDRKQETEHQNSVTSLLQLKVCLMD
jgi:GMP/IMP 5'-nucleotidase